MADKKSAPNIGLRVFLVALVLNMIFVQFQIGGIVRELSRLGVIVGIVMMVMRLFRKKDKENP
jgi:hypothetical protein